MGLNHPSDYAAWARWARSRNRARSIKHAVVSAIRPAPPSPWVLTASSARPQVLAALDVQRGTSVDALIAPLSAIDADAAILSRGRLADGIAPPGWRTTQLSDLTELPDSIRTVVSAGSFEAVSLPVHAWARPRGVAFVVVQHGLLTPFAPPLPEGAHLLAWTEADAAFWAEGRGDVTTGVGGSALLWAAAQRPGMVGDAPPVWLGQLHGAELPRREFARVAGEFCRRTGATYRPHPAERDVASRLQHTWWRRRGVPVDDSGVPLDRLGRGVASIFSTGVLEAAAMGLPAWVFHPNPPAWVAEVWQRYGLARWGGDPTPAPDLGKTAPSERIAAAVKEVTP